MIALVSDGLAAGGVHRVMDASRRGDPWLGLAASALAVALVTCMIAVLEEFVPVLSLGALYVFAVVPVAIGWGLRFALGVSVASMLVFNFFFLPPVHSFTLSDSRNWFALAVYVLTSAVVSDLAARSRRRATESALLADVARSLLERGSVSGELDQIAAGAARALGAADARIELGEPSAELRGRPRRDAADRRHAPRRHDRAARSALAVPPGGLSAAAGAGIAAGRRHRSGTTRAPRLLEAEALRRSDALKTALAAHREP